MNKKLRKLIEIREVGVGIPLVIAVLFFGLKSNAFLSPDNIINMFRIASFTFITAIGMTFLIISGGLDLSVGAVYAFSGVLCGLFMQLQIPIGLSVLLACVSGVVFGVMNGVFVQFINLPPFIATMGGMYIVRGLVLGIRRGNPVYPLPDTFNLIGQGNLFSFGIAGLPYVVIIAALLGLIAAFTLKHTSYGRMIFAVGGNAETSRLAGIPVRKIRFSAYVMTGVLASLTGILMSARMGSAQPNVGSGFEMQVIAASVIGGVSLNGGTGTILGTLLGSIFMTIITNGMTMIKVSAYWQQLVLGLVLVMACALDQIRLHFKK